MGGDFAKALANVFAARCGGNFAAHGECHFLDRWKRRAEADGTGTAFSLSLVDKSRRAKSCGDGKAKCKKSQAHVFEVVCIGNDEQTMCHGDVVRIGATECV